MWETQEMPVRSPSREDPWRSAWQPTPIFLPGESHEQRSLMGTVHGVTESWTWLKWHNMSALGSHRRNQVSPHHRKNNLGPDEVGRSQVYRKAVCFGQQKPKKISVWDSATGVESSWILSVSIKLCLLPRLETWQGKTISTSHISILGPRGEKAVAPHSSTLAWKIPWSEDDACSHLSRSRLMFSQLSELNKKWRHFIQ